MSERLKQIWAGFSSETTRKLTGRGVDNILVPHRTDYAETDEGFLPENYNAPAESAFSALRENLKTKEKMFGGKKKKAGDTRSSLPSEAEDFTAATAFSSSSDDLIRGLRATAMRVERPDIDYGAFVASPEGKAQFKKHKKKKRFGLF
ncbi:hypothetical protein PUV54_06440 [Hyphococcus flavus]|uniref:Uncharacterized protein n=1 Tax=Hyphococcus flavus TaxID=1866326 RepID=A0AAF0CGS8_9PROT|nr:hypothetical protein [Hyphococcus flavus]WDI32834.1 hypothetical protein PUV54_06440 [Hyphococcus flavus]